MEIVLIRVFFFITVSWIDQCAYFPVALNCLLNMWFVIHVFCKQLILQLIYDSSVEACSSETFQWILLTENNITKSRNLVLPDDSMNQKNSESSLFFNESFISFIFFCSVTLYLNNNNKLKLKHDWNSAEVNFDNKVTS